MYQKDLTLRLSARLAPQGLESGKLTVFILYRIVRQIVLRYGPCITVQLLRSSIRGERRLRFRVWKWDRCGSSGDRRRANLEHFCHRETAVPEATGSHPSIIVRKPRTDFLAAATRRRFVDPLLVLGTRHSACSFALCDQEASDPHCDHRLNAHAKHSADMI